MRTGLTPDVLAAIMGLGLGLGRVCRIGVQPLLGLEGDPMRLLFERDLTPHPQASHTPQTSHQPPGQAHTQVTQAQPGQSRIPRSVTRPQARHTRPVACLIVL